jgi:uncharacterized membrane protein YhaH (DUF805 family)
MTSETAAPSSGRAPLDKPLYGANPIQAVARLFQKYAVFSGRASRSEYWWAVLFCLISPFVLWALGLAIGYSTGTPYVNPNTGQPGTLPGPAWAILGIAGLLLYLALLLPGMSVTVRRLHDANLSGLLYLLAFVPVGSIVVLVLTFMETNPAGARFDEGNQPYSGMAPAPIASEAPTPPVAS